MSDETFKVEVDGATFEIDLLDGGVTVDGRRVKASVISVSANTYSLLIEGQSYEFTLSRNGTSHVISGIGGTAEVSVYDHVAQLLLESRVDARHVHSTDVRAPMPGLVLKIEVAPGDVVHAGSGLLVLEAMKMENEIFATGEAIVEAVYVDAGSPVQKGQLLVTLR